MLTKTVICLANSRKMYPNRCFAGKDISTKAWVRPVSNHDNGAIALSEMNLGGGAVPGLLDVVEIPIERQTPTYYQPENVLISQQRWKKTGLFPMSNIDSICDNADSIWRNDPFRDRIPISKLQAEHPESSLLLIKLKHVRLEKRHNKVRAIFNYRDIAYDLGVTDLTIEARFREECNGFNLEDQKGYFCISLGEPWQSPHDREPCCYKLVASVIFTP